MPDFITGEEEEDLLFRIDNAPKPKWRELSNRRLQNWGGFPHPKVTAGEPLPAWLELYVNKIANLKLFEGKRPNHVLVNEYLPGQGILPHEDGPVFYPVICTINLSSHTVLNLWPKKEQVSEAEKCCILLEARSLVVIRDDAYTSYLHGIDEIKSDLLDEKICNLSQCKGRKVEDVLQRDRRISCTIRYVSNMRLDLLSLLRK